MITLQNWLADRKRKYADGLALFQALAPEEMRKKYIAFFSEVKEVPQFDSHFTVLVNKLTTVARLSSAQPQITISERGSILLKTAVAATKAIEKTADQLKGDKVLKEILVKESELFKLQDKITELEEDNDDKSGEIDQLQAELEEAQEELQELQDQFALLRPGAKIATYSSLPDNIRTIFDEVRQITPCTPPYSRRCRTRPLLRSNASRSPIRCMSFGPAVPSYGTRSTLGPRVSRSS